MKDIGNFDTWQYYESQFFRNIFEIIGLLWKLILQTAPLKKKYCLKSMGNDDNLKKNNTDMSFKWQS